MREIIKENPVMAIFRHLPFEETIAYTEAIYQGGIRAFEVAFNSPRAAEQIRLLRDHFGDSALIGAGTTISVELVKAAIDAGASFLLTPSANREVLEYAAKHELLLLPGVMTPTDVDLCRNYGFKTLKLFPASSLAPDYLSNLKGPFDDTEYVAVGGVTPDKLETFYRQGFIGAGIGSQLLPKALREAPDFEAIRAYINEIVQANPWKKN